MKEPSELSEPKKLPDDLKLLMASLKIQENDPLFAVLAWHWLRINESRDVLQELAAGLDQRKSEIEEKAREIGALMNVRHEKLEAGAQTLQDILVGLSDVHKELSQKPLAISEQITKDLAHPIGQSVTLVQQLAVEAKTLLADVAKSRSRVHRSHLITAFLSGYATAALILSWTFLHFFLR